LTPEKTQLREKSVDAYLAQHFIDAPDLPKISLCSIKIIG